MINDDTAQGRSHERMFLVALAACCVGPMLVIIVLTSVLGMAIGAAGALTLGLLAALGCVAFMVQRHRRGTTTKEHG